MSGIRKTPLPGGKFQGWYRDAQGKRVFFTGTHDRRETVSMAARLEDDQTQIRIGYRPAPSSADRAASQPISQAAGAYLAWGLAVGGLHGGPWDNEHAARQEQHLTWWTDRLGLKTVGDLAGCLARVEAVLRAEPAGSSSLNHRAATLKAFVGWLVTRGMLGEHPLSRLSRLSRTRKSQRRALTPPEIQALLKFAPPARALLYELAICSGLRLGELRSLRPEHLDARRGGLLLDAAWTKNRTSGFQPLPAGLVARLRLPLTISAQPARDLALDLTAAGLTKWAPGGKVDFHALRVTFVTLALEAGAAVKEAQALARHSTPSLTMNTYAKARTNEMQAIVETLAAKLQPEPRTGTHP